MEEAGMAVNKPQDEDDRVIDKREENLWYCPSQSTINEAAVDRNARQQDKWGLFQQTLAS